MKSAIIKNLQKNINNLIPNQCLSIIFESQLSLRELWQPDFIASAVFKNLKFKIVGLVASQINYSMLKEKILHLKLYTAQKKNILPIIVAYYLSPDRRQLCKDSGVYFIDLSGNVFIEYGDLYMERDGFPNKFSEQRMGRGPFSDKASLILRLILSNKEKVWGVREIASYVKLDPGFVSRIAKELEKRNYIVRLNSKLKLHDPESILDDWVRDYNYKKNQEAKYFYLAEDPEQIINKMQKLNVEEETKYALGLHAGANLICPFAVYNEVHVYVQNHKEINVWIEKMGLKEVDQGANIIFLVPYYKHSVFFNKQEIKGLWVVSDIQLYIDLYNYPIRGREQAGHLYEKRLKMKFES